MIYFYFVHLKLYLYNMYIIYISYINNEHITHRGLVAMRIQNDEAENDQQYFLIIGFHN